MKAVGICNFKRTTMIVTLDADLPNMQAFVWFVGLAIVIEEDHPPAGRNG